jgi:putative ABC transport system ATP-binding protein
LTHAWVDRPPLFDIEDLSLPQGQHLFIQGPSGCGKSTLLSLLAGVIQVQSGVCEVLGRDMTKLNQFERDALRGEQIGVIFQQFNLIPYLDVWANVMLPTRLFASREQAARRHWGSAAAQAGPVLAALGLHSDHWHQAVHTLSVGQQQRVAAARALMGHPPLIIADEPTSALDEDNKDEFIRLLMDQARAQGASVVLVSHDARLASHFDQVHTLTAWGAP